MIHNLEEQKVNQKRTKIPIEYNVKCFSINPNCIWFMNHDHIQYFKINQIVEKFVLTLIPFIEFSGNELKKLRILLK